MTNRQAVQTMLILLPGGCATLPSAGTPVDRIVLREHAEACLRRALACQENPAVRLQAVEALESALGEDAAPSIRTALSDGNPAVRFAACVAVGRLRYEPAGEALIRLVDDSDPSVQLAAMFALHRLGDSRRTGRISRFLIEHPDVTVRRNAALVLGLLEEPSAIRVLARAMRDQDVGVRHHVLEAMARLGTAEARSELTLMTNAGVGSEEVFAIFALAQTNDTSFFDTFQYKFETATHLETRLAAAYGLGKLGSHAGLEAAVAGLHMSQPYLKDVNDPAESQILRVRQLAARALGAIGREEALPALSVVLGGSDDLRVQVSAAQAVLEILRQSPGVHRAGASHAERED